MEVPKFKENVLICFITVKKVRDLLHSLLQGITILGYIQAHLFFLRIFTN